MKITGVHSFWILDSRSNPTILTVVKTKNNTGVASSPSGASVGKYEAVELRDNTAAFHGMGVSKAINNINTFISKRIVGLDVCDQEDIDSAMVELDGTPNKSRLGANAILSVSLAAARCAAAEKNEELYKYLGGFKGFPTPMLNIINGRKHAGNDLDVQECLIIPNTDSFESDMVASSEIYYELKKLIEKKYGKAATTVGDEGGFSPPISDVEEALNLIADSVKRCGYEKEVGLGIDVAASDLYKDASYLMHKKRMKSDELIDYYSGIVKKYPVWSIEDPFEQDDFKSFSKLNRLFKGKVQIVGDDLLVTSLERLKTAVKEGSCNALILKPNQVGTLTEAKRAAQYAHRSGLNVIVSHRSGETCDDFIADLCLGWGCEEIKAGAPARGERVSKYNRLLMIEQLMRKKD